MTTPAEVLRTKLSPYLGPFTAKNAVQMVAKQSVGMDAESVTRAQVPALIDALGPTLRTLLGREKADKVAADIRKELAL